MTELDTTNGPAGDQNSPDDDTAGRTDPDHQNALDAADQEHDHDDDQDAGGRGEAKQRRRAQKAERRVAELEELLDSTRRHIIGTMVQSQGFKPALLAGVATEDLLNDGGLPDAEKITAAIATAADEVGATRQPGLTPNPQQGTGGQPRRRSSWSQALKGS